MKLPWQKKARGSDTFDGKSCLLIDIIVYHGAVTQMLLYEL